MTIKVGWWAYTKYSHYIFSLTPFGHFTVLEKDFQKAHVPLPGIPVTRRCGDPAESRCLFSSNGLPGCSFRPGLEWWVQCSCRCSVGFPNCGFGRPNWYPILICGFGTSLPSSWHPFWDFFEKFSFVGKSYFFLICGFGTSKLVPYSHMWVWDVHAVILAPFLSFF